MTINIISTQVNRNKITGPKKVLNNILKGFDKIGVKYVFNQPINKYKYNWIHDDQRAIIEAGFVGKSVLVGPNTAVLPKDLPVLRKKLPKGSIYIHPSKWSVDMWKYLNFNEARVDFWPVGIDLKEFENIERRNCSKILVYFKQRDEKLLQSTLEILKKLNIEYILIKYGFYDEYEYKNALKNCYFGIWIGCSESQGIGLQEALATNLPLIVLDATSVFDTVPTDSKNYASYDFPKQLENIQTSTAPYFDQRCGIKIDKIDDLEQAVDIMKNNIEHYNPRAYIEENLTLEKSAKWLVSFFEQMDIKETKSYNYQKISKVLFYTGLIFQKWAWMWIWRKFFG
jgi:hypothetical protein